jgi:hypothetical protein
MSFLLSSQNAFDYLTEQGICTQKEQELSNIEQKFAKNFNLLLSLPEGRKLLVKQERHNPAGKTAGEFLNEWRIQEFLQQFPELNHLQPLMPEVLHFDAAHSLIVFNYLNDYRDLADFYAKEKVFPTAIASALGAIVATIHRTTLNRQDYRDFFTQEDEGVALAQISKVVRELERITPEVFGRVPTDGLKFFALYQRYDSLGKALAELADAFDPCCLTHNDLKLNNILLHDDWEQKLLTAEPSGSSTLRVIDWERCGWGDPPFDLGMLIGSYLLIWLSSLVVSKTIAIEESLRMAMTPLEQLQPSIAALARAYFSNFPEILESRPQFLRRVMQFSGLALIIQIQVMIQYEKSFGNMGICMLQVAKGLLCRPEQLMPTVFGAAASEITGLQPALA